MKSHCSTLIFATLLIASAVLESKGENASACYKNEKILMLWDMTHYCISKARDIYFSVAKTLDSGLSASRKKARSRPYLEKAKQLILELEESYLSIEQAIEYSIVSLPDSIACDQKPSDCSDVLTAGYIRSGVYTIWPAGRPLVTFCDMETDGGGWTVIQRRGNFSKLEDFYRGWKDYARGFGDIARDFWLGNENIHLITNQSEYEIRFDLTDAEGERRFAVYNTFWLDDEEKGYTLHIGNYSGDAGDSVAYHNEHVFSTRDSNNSRCAKQRMGGWWYVDCTDSNLNGVYNPGVEGRQGITWYSWHDTYSLAGSEMKLRRKN